MVASLLVFWVIIRPGIFNLLPYSIHQYFFKNLIKEDVFIISFDVVFSILIFLLIRLICNAGKGGNVDNVPN